MSATSDDDRVRIRTATPADAAVVAAIYAPYVSDTAISFEVVPPSADPGAIQQRQMEEERLRQLRERVAGQRRLPLRADVGHQQLRAQGPEKRQHRPSPGGKPFACV